MVSKLVFPEEQDAVGQRQEFEDCDGHSEGSTHPLDEEGFGVDLKLDFLDSLYIYIYTYGMSYWNIKKSWNSSDGVWWEKKVGFYELEWWNMKQWHQWWDLTNNEWTIWPNNSNGECSSKLSIVWLLHPIILSATQNRLGFPLHPCCFQWNPTFWSEGSKHNLAERLVTSPVLQK